MRSPKTADSNTYTLPTNRTSAQIRTTMPFQKIGASASNPVIRSLSSRTGRGRRRRSRRCRTTGRRRGAGPGLGRVDAHVLGQRHLLDGQDVIHQIVDLLVVHGSGEPHAPRRHVGPSSTLGNGVDDVVEALDEWMTERRPATNRLQVRHYHDAAVEHVLAAVQPRAMAAFAVEPDLVLLAAWLGGQLAALDRRGQE